MESLELRKARLKGLILGKKIHSLMTVVDCQFDEDTGEETRTTLSTSEFYTPDESEDLEIEIIYNEKQIRN